MTETTKQNLSILLITILIAASVYIFIHFIKPAMAERQDLLTKINEAQAKIQMLNDYKAKFQILAQSYQNLGDKINMINQALPDEAQTAQVLATLDAISKKTGISLNDLNFNTSAGDNYSTLEIKTGFNTTYSSFKDWLTQIENELRLMDLKGANIKVATQASSKSRRTSSSILQFSIDLLTYYQL
jgi:Tfp pilus assembly protein PilO